MDHMWKRIYTHKRYMGQMLTRYLLTYYHVIQYILTHNSYHEFEQ